MTRYSEGTGKNPGVRLAWSDDAGRSFSPVRVVSGNIVDANHPVLAPAEDGRLLPVFQGRDPMQQQGSGPLCPYLLQVGPNEAGSRPMALLGKGASIAYPAVLTASLGRIFISWTEAGKDGTPAYLIRGRSARSPAGGENP